MNQEACKMSIKPAVSDVTENVNRTTANINNGMKIVTKTESVNHTFESVFVKQEINESENNTIVKQEEIVIKKDNFVESIPFNGIKSKTNDNLDSQYLESYGKEHPYICTHCNFNSRQKNQLILHQKACKEKKPILKPFQCTFCDHKFSWKIKLTEHLRTHTGEKPFCCSMCVYKTAWKHELIRHFRIHSGEKPFRCNVCDYKSNDKSGLNVHLRRHTGEKLFICTFCDYKAVRKARLLKHLKSHDGK